MKLTVARVSTEGSKEADYDSKTWPALHKLALETPEAGVHFQGTTYTSVVTTEVEY